MKKIIRRILAYILIWIICVSAVDVNVFAQENMAVEYAEDENSVAVGGLTTEVEETTTTEVEEITTEVEEESTTEVEETTTEVEEETATEVEETTTEVEEESTTEVEETTTEVGEESTIEVEETTTKAEEETATEVEETTTEIEETLTVESEENTWDGITTKNIYETSDYRVIFSLDSYWEGGYNANIIIENISNTVIENWYLKYDFANAISNIWNAEIYSYEAGAYVIKNAGWNQDIAAGSQIQYGFSSNENFIEFPQTYELMGEYGSVQDDECSIEYYLDSDWGDGFTGRISITNNSDQIFEDWMLEFEFAREITEIWNGVISEHDGAYYAITNAGYNANINQGETISFGFKGTYGDITDEPFGFQLSQVKYVQENDDFDAILAEVEEYRKKAEESINNWEIPDFPVVQREFRDILKNAETFYYNGREYESSEQYVEAKSAYQDTWKYLEQNRNKLDDINTLIAELRSNPEADYDGDLLLNGFEMDAFCGYLDPFNNDTDGDGLSDGEDDYDLDGLSNYEEQRFGTSPINADTDEGSMSDKREIELGLNPTNPEDDNVAMKQNIISEETGVSVQILAEGDAEGKIYIDIAETCIDSEYAISPFYEINADVKFSTAQITIPVDLSDIPEDDYDKLYIVYYDEDLGGFIPLENSKVDVSNSSVSATTNHFSLYAVFYVKNWGTYFNVPLNQPKRTTEDQFNLVDIMFVIDSSGSMSWNDSNDYRKTAAKAFVDALLPGTQVGVVVGDRAGVVDFDSYAVLRQPLTDDFEAVKKAIDAIDDNGGTNIGAGVKIANDELISNSEEERLKIEILLTDGSGSYSSSYTTEAINNGIVIYTIGLGSGVNSSLLSQIAAATGGQYFHVDNASELPVVYDRIKDVTIVVQDTDKDGIPDSLETEGMRVGLLNSELVYTDPEDPDSDDDGLLDGEEIDVSNISKISLFGYELEWYKMICNPNENDTDGDRLTDYEELKEYNSNPKKRHSDSDNLDDFTECIDFYTDPNLEDTDGDGFDDYYECTDTRYNPVVFDTVVKSDGQYIIAKNQSLAGRLHIQSPIVVNEGIALTLKNIDKIVVEDLASRMRYESSIFRIYGELIASDDSSKQLEYDGEDLWTGVFVDENGKADLNKFTISGMEYALYIYGGDLDITNSNIKSCYQGIEATDGAVVNVSDTYFRAIDDTNVFGDLAVRVIGGKEYFHSGGKIDEFATGIVLICNENESKIKNVEIKNGDTGIYIDASKVNISNVTFDKNSIGIDATGHSTNVYLENSNVWDSSAYGVRMSKQAVVYTYNNAFYGNGIDIKNEFLKEMLLSLVTSLIPYAGDGTDLFSSIYGRDVFTDESLSAFERGLGFLCLGELRRVDDVIDATKIAEKLPNGVKYLDVAASLTTRYGDDLVTLLNKCDSKTADLVLEMAQKHGDSFVEIFLKYSDEGVELLASKHGREAIDVIAKLGDDGIRALKFNDELLSKYSKLDNIEKFAAETATLAKELNCKGFTSRNYLDVMKKSFGWKTSKKLGDTLQAHHIFPEKFFGEGADYANLLKDAGISYCDPRLLVWYDKSTHLSNALKYNDDIYEVIERYKDNLPELIKGIREVARRYGFEPKF